MLVLLLYFSLWLLKWFMVMMSSWVGSGVLCCVLIMCDAMVSVFLMMVVVILVSVCSMLLRSSWLSRLEVVIWNSLRCCMLRVVVMVFCGLFRWFMIVSIFVCSVCFDCGASLVLFVSSCIDFGVVVSRFCLNIFGRKFIVNMVVVNSVELEWCSIRVEIVIWVSWLF